LLGDASKARRELNWKPKTSFKELVKEMTKADLIQAEFELKLVSHKEQF
jgi:GDPmannose 4,6-dehydratase